MPQQSGTRGVITSHRVQIGDAPAEGHAAPPTAVTSDNVKMLPKMMEDANKQIDAMFMTQETAFRWPLLKLVRRNPNKVKYEKTDFHMNYESPHFNKYNDEDQKSLDNKLNEITTSGYNDFKYNFNFGTSVHGEDERMSFAMCAAISQIQSDRVCQINELLKRLPASLREYVELFLYFQKNIDGIMSSNTLEAGVNKEIMLDLITRYDNFPRERFMRLSNPTWNDPGPFIDPSVTDVKARMNEVAKHLLNHMHSQLSEQLDDFPDNIKAFNEAAKVLHPIIKEVGKFKAQSKINQGKIDEVKQKGIELRNKLIEGLDLNGRNNKVHKPMSEVKELYSRYLNSVSAQKIKDYFAKKEERPADDDYAKFHLFYQFLYVPWLCLLARYKIYTAVLERYLEYLSKIDEILNKEYTI